MRVLFSPDTFAYLDFTQLVFPPRVASVLLAPLLSHLWAIRALDSGRLFDADLLPLKLRLELHCFDMTPE